MSNESDDVKRWTARRKATAVMDILKGKTTAAELARSHDLTVAEVEQWLEDFVSMGTEALRSHPRDAEARHKAEKKELLAKIHCGRDGWGVFVPVIDCCTREVLGHALERMGRAKTAERALEEALLSRFGTLRNAPAGMLLRHDNGLVFGSRQYRAVVKDYGLTQEYITPYTPQQNGLCERFIKTFKEELCWTRRFQSIEHARLAVRAWIDHDNSRRPHQSLKYLSPTQYHERQCKLAA